MRVDGSLMGVKDHEDMSGGGLLPEWDRGHFSLIYTSEKEWEVTHIKHTYHTHLSQSCLPESHALISP